MANIETVLKSRRRRSFKDTLLQKCEVVEDSCCRLWSPILSLSYCGNNRRWMAAVVSVLMLLQLPSLHGTDDNDSSLLPSSVPFADLNATVATLLAAALPSKKTPSDEAQNTINNNNDYQGGLHREEETVESIQEEYEGVPMSRHRLEHPVKRNNYQGDSGKDDETFSFAQKEYDEIEKLQQVGLLHPVKRNNSLYRQKTHDTKVTMDQQHRDEQTFMLWCKHALGIETILEIRTFDYYDYMRALPVEDDWSDDDDDDTYSRHVMSVDALPLLRVRGLAASRDIMIGEVVIRIPLQALLTVATTIDHDPVLSRVMGPEARRQHGWKTLTGSNVNNSNNDENTNNENNNNEDASYLVEIPLLAVALLHHKRLGATSPLAPYMRIIETTPVTNMPFLWPAAKLRTLSNGVRRVVRGVRREMKIMYETIVVPLIMKHAELFGRPQYNDEHWMFSFEKFQWAFAIVNSRHWQLPISDLQETKPTKQKEEEFLPPADMPTESWIRKQHIINEQNNEATSSFHLSTFLAPVADLLNFGPPCTRGTYNADSHSFEIIASCDFRAGQEVTFWYSDECDHVMVGVYGFTHPIVPTCPTTEDYKRSSEEWKTRAERLETQLVQVNAELETVDAELEYVEMLLNKCDSNGRLRHEHVRGALLRDSDDVERRRGVRKARQERNTEF